jgi:hypothetical protein
MTIYAGETVQITTDLKDFDGDTPLTVNDVLQVTLEIFRQGVSVHGPVLMVWDADSGRWEYIWDSDGFDPGTYLARCQADGTQFSAWEFKNLRLNRNRAGS